MTDEVIPTTQAVETPAQSAEVTDATPEDVFDKDRAMQTIHSLRVIEKQAKVDRKELDRLKADEAKRTEAQMSETERLQKQAAELSAHNEKLQADIWKRDIVSETGIPAIFADRLKGATKDEMLADAQEIAKQLPQMKVAPKLPPTNPANANTEETEAAKRARLFGVQKNIFDIASIKESGGGVIWKDKPQ